MANTVAVTDLRRRVGGHPVPFLLDVRAEEEFGAWKLDESGRLNTLNVPYIEFLENEAEAIARVPRGVEPVYVLCAKGGSSEWVAELLQEHGIPAVSVRGGMQEWAHVADVVPIEPAGGTDLLILQVRRPATGCISYVVVVPGSSSALVMDPLEALTQEYIRLADQHKVSIKMALDTHVHADHVSGLRALAAASGCEAVLPSGARDRGLTFSARFVSDGERLELGGHEVEVIATPGHTTESVCYLLDSTALCTGDTLFVDSVGRPDLESGTSGMRSAAARLHSSLKRLFASVPPTVMVLPGHFPTASAINSDEPITASIQDLRRRMPVVELDEEQFASRILEDLPPQPQRHTEIIAVNLGASTPPEDERLEMELGPNNCASTRSSLVG